MTKRPRGEGGIGGGENHRAPGPVPGPQALQHAEQTAGRTALLMALASGGRGRTDVNKRVSRWGTRATSSVEKGRDSSAGKGAGGSQG